MIPLVKSAVLTSIAIDHCKCIIAFAEKVIA